MERVSRTLAGQAEIQALAAELRSALAKPARLPSLTETAPELTVDEAYQIQFELIAGEEERQIGWKVGLGDAERQAAFGASEPFFGPLLQSMERSDGAKLSLSDYCAAKLEPELAFVLAEPLEGPGVGIAQVLAASAGVIPTIEVIDNRIEPKHIKDMVADRGATAHVIVGGTMLPVDAIDLMCNGMNIARNGRIIATGTAAQGCKTHPASMVAWLANRLATFGRRLEAGTFVLTGAMAVVPVEQAGDTFTATFDRLGSLTVHIVP